MLTLYSYPELFGVADNNGYGLKVYAFLKLAGVPFTHEHVFDASKAPRGQLPYIVDDGVTIGDSETILAHLTQKYRLTIDAAADAGAAHHRPSGHAPARRSLLGDVVFALEGRSLLPGVPRRLHGAACADRRGRAEQGQGIQRAALLLPGHRPLPARPGLCARAIGPAGAGRPDPAGWLCAWREARSIDAGIYGFIANIHYYPIPTPLKAFVSDHPNLVRHCEAIHAAVSCSS